jgi:hypothetical protein
MHDDDAVTPASAIEEELVAAMRETARLHSELEAVESDLARIVEMFLQATGSTDLTLDFLQSLGHPRHTIH